MLKSLEPLYIEAKQVIYHELDCVDEVIFIETGEYNVGYKVNKCEKFKLRFGQKTVIGAFNICYNMRHIFIYKTHLDCKGYFIRKSNWKSIMDEFPEFFFILK